MSQSEVAGFSRFESMVKIGSGVSATVYRAFDRQLGGNVALKVMSPHLSTDPISLERFRREIQITRHINHRGIVQIHELLLVEGKIILVMELIEGQTLKDHIRLNAPLAVQEAVRILTRLLECLSSCHAGNVIHRDLKPQNIMIRPDGELKLLDFGIARMTSLSDLTQTGSSLGSPEYMAPELFATNTYDPRTDIYALGVIGFEMLTGRLPYRGDSLAVLFHEHLNAEVPSLSGLRPEVPGWLEGMLLKMLAKKPHQRYQSVDEAATDLGRQEVASSRLPVIKRRECVSCGNSTADQLPVCTLCGYCAAAEMAAGKVNISLTGREQQEEIREFIQKIFGLKLHRLRKHQRLLLENLDPLTAEVVKKSAQRHRIYLESRTVSRGALFMEATIQTGYTGLGLAGFCLIYRLAELVSAGSYGTVDPLGLLAILLPVPLAFMPLVAVWKRSFPPLIQDPSARSGLSERFGWLRDLVPLLKVKRTEAMQIYVSELLEKFVLITSHLAATSPETLTRAGELHSMVFRLIEVANCGSELEARLNTDGLAGVLRQLDGNPDDARLKMRIEAHYALEESHSLLVNRLIHFQSRFNTILGRMLAENREDGRFLIEELFQAVMKMDLEDRLVKAAQKDLELAA